MENPEKIYRSNKVIFFTMMPYAYYFTANSPFIVQSNRIKMAIPCDENHQRRFWRGNSDFQPFFIMLYKSGIYKNMHDNKISF